MAPSPDAPLVVVSADCHIGRGLVDDLRPYCPSGLLDEFDAFAAHVEELRARIYGKVEGRSTAGLTRNRRTDGHFDMDARRADLDHEGVAAEIIFHGSQNEEPLPWGSFVVFLLPDTDDPARRRGAGRSTTAGSPTRAPPRRASRRPRAVADVGCGGRDPRR
ncbi:MAG: hypothetical protein U0W40_16120 [Acidimicrobiia bacterium]